MLHYDNNCCFTTNWRQLWSECRSTDPPKRLYVCRAAYHMTGENHQVVERLAALPPSKFNYAADALCVAVGCDVRLVRNINVTAGLVNSATGTVVTVVYNNADCSALFQGEHPPPYCIIVDLTSFRGFLIGAEQPIVPFLNQPRWVVIYREKFAIARADLPSWIARKQETRDCWRQQFSIKHMSSCHDVPQSTGPEPDALFNCH